MKIDISRTNQVLTWNRDTQIAIYVRVQKAVQKTEWMRLGGFPIAVVSGSVALVKATGLLGESSLKGVTNIFGSLCSDHFNGKKGVKQLFLNTPVALIGLPLTTAIVAINLVVTPIWMATDPKGCANFFFNANLNSQMHALPFWS
jgi:hypothetical protein